MHYPELAEQITWIKSGQHQITPDDWHTLSAWEYDVKLTHALAVAREDARRLEPPSGRQ